VNDGANLAVDTIYNEHIANIATIDEHEVIFISNVLNGLLVDHDSISVSKNDKLMDIFEGIGYAQDYAIPKNSNDRKIVLDAINRFGSRILVEIKKHFRNTNFEHSETLYGVTRGTKVAADLVVLESYYLRYRNLLRSFIYKFSKKLNPSLSKFTYTSFNFDLSLETGYASDFAGQEVNIKSNDVFWT
jgi:hypothetical protein